MEKDPEINTICDSYCYDYPIHMIHQYVVAHFKEEYRSLPLLRTHLSQKVLQYQQNINAITQNHRITIEREINKIHNQIQLIVDNTQVKEYMDQARPLLKQYKQIGELKYDCITKKPAASYDEIEFRLHIIENYLNIARKIIKINIQRITTLGYNCASCGKELDLSDSTSSGLIRCECGIYHNVLKSTKSSKTDNSASSVGNMIGPSSDYAPNLNYQNTIIHHQGRQQVNEQEFMKVLLGINEYLMTRKSYPSYQIILTHPINEENEKDGTNSDDLIEAISHVNNKYYKHYNLLLNRLWGWPLDDLSNLETRLHERFQRSEIVFNKIKSKPEYNMKSSMNSQLRLYLELLQIGYPCKANRFKLPKTKSTVEKLYRMWNEMCEILGWSSVDIASTDIYSSLIDEEHEPI